MSKNKNEKLWNAFKSKVDHGNALNAFKVISLRKEYDEEYIEYIHEFAYLLQAEINHINSLLGDMSNASSIFERKYKGLMKAVERAKGDIRDFMSAKIESLGKNPRLLKRFRMFGDDLHKVFPWKEEDIYSNAPHPILDYLKKYVADMETR
jgi:hypothetical protein